MKNTFIAVTILSIFFVAPVAQAASYGGYASGFGDSASGSGTYPNGYGTYASGYGTAGSSQGGYASGFGTSGGSGTYASGYGAYASGYGTYASGYGGYASGYGGYASGYGSSNGYGGSGSAYGSSNGYGGHDGFGGPGGHGGSNGYGQSNGYGGSGSLYAESKGHAGSSGYAGSNGHAGSSGYAGSKGYGGSSGTIGWGREIYAGKKTTSVVTPAVVYYAPLQAMPYTGLDLGPVGTAVYWAFLIFWCLLAAYLLAVKRVHNHIYEWLVAFLFGSDGEERVIKESPAKHISQIMPSVLIFAPHVEAELPTSADAPPEDIDPFVATQIKRQ